MVVETFLELVEATPFREIELFLTDGRSFSVKHPDFIAIDAGSETVTVYHEKSAFADIIDIIAVVSVRHEVVG